MAGQRSNAKANTDATATPIPPDAYRAFADFLAAGNTASFEDWYGSDAGKTALLAFQDQANAALRAGRMSNSKAVWRDLKAFGTIASEKGIAAAKAERDYLIGLDLDKLEATEESPVSTRTRKAKANGTDAAEDDADDE
jgi:hypothetical protein